MPPFTLTTTYQQRLTRVPLAYTMPKRDRFRDLLSTVPRPWKQKQERRTRGDEETEPPQELAAICEECRNLDPNDSEFNDLYVWSSPPSGEPPSTCRFCQFIYDAVTAMVPSFASEAQIHASVESVPAQNRIDLRFGGRLAVHVYNAPALVPDRQRQPLAGNTRKENESFAFVLEQIQNCKQNHAVCSQRSPTFQPTRLIHCAGKTGSLRLVELDPITEISCPVEYVALSYCWGASASFKTTRENIDQHRKGFEVSELPKSLQDAIEVAKKLNVEYIWIDAICIVQGDAADWERESGMMADVYGNACVTIAALSASSVADGFLHLKRNPLQISRSWSDDHGATTALVAQEKVRTGLHVSTLRNNWSPTMGTQQGDFDPVQTRGWCFQEEILSNRYVAFSRQEMQWSCRATSTCQCGSLDHGESTGPLRQAPSIQDDPFGFWAEMLPFYTQRNLSYPHDRLPAISGLARTIQRCTSADYVAGIWLQDLKRSLNWKLQDDINTCPSTYRAPSFSWASIDSPIFMYTTSDLLPDIVSVVSWDVEPKRQDPFGELKHASLTLNGFVHTATLRHRSETSDGFEFRVNIASEAAVLDDDTHLVKFETKSSDGTEMWSVRRSDKEVKHVKGEWGPGVAVLALCLAVSEKAAEFIILGQSPHDATKLERIGSARFTAVTPSYVDFANEVTRDCYRQTITLV
ncbi:heterokaryon incompatibility protein-domain-containing protein [Chaetomium fimeti]|uniref:Heterokaryon incompatibility protein-domain-containing protein n=1 Tax=Chaetomium fimeti TaxID=1854472 RepID=A0AAE0LMW3_9PEZI|nr:heterokaryon incompatibility protein-domain-containing protein [Chaetomium fimeti]